MASGYLNLTTYSDEYYTDFKYRVYWETTQNVSARTTQLKITYQVYGGTYMSDEEQWPFYLYFRTEDYEYAYSDNGRALYDNYWTAATTIKRYSWNSIHTTTFTIQHADNGVAPGLDDGTDISIFFVDENGEPMEGACGSLHADDFPIPIADIVHPATITTASSFNDEENPVIYYSNPMGTGVSKLEVCITNPERTTTYVPYRTLGTSGTRYEFILTGTEQAALIEASVNTNTLQLLYVMRSTINGTPYETTKSVFMYVINANPEIIPRVIDSNELTTSLTGNPEKCIRGHNSMSYSLEATTLKGATISSYSVTCGSHKSTNRFGVFENVEKDFFVFAATDSRGNTVSKTVPLDMIDYQKISCNQKVLMIKKEDSETEAQIRVEIHGNYFNQSFGAVDNELTLEIRHTQNDGTMGEWYAPPSLIPILDGNTYTASINISGFDVSGTYEFECRASDLLEAATTEPYSVTFTPIFDWSATDFNFNVPVTMKGLPLIDYIMEQAPFVDYVIEQGTAAMGSNGTWYWSKWKSGKAECYGRRNYGNMAISTAWGSVYQSDYFNQDLPEGLFIEAPTIININFDYSSDNYYAWIVKGGIHPTATTTGRFFAVRGTATTAAAAHISFHCIGRWK